MQALLKLSRGIDWLNTQVGKYVIWLILGSTFISGVNAVVRKVFNVSSNGFLEVQWYLFAASFLLAAGYTLLQGEHVKVDVVSSRFSKRTQIWIDVFGYIAFLTPMCLAVLWYGIPFFYRAFVSGEMSNNAGGLLRWPVYLMMPLGFGLLLAEAWLPAVALLPLLVVSALLFDFGFQSALVAHQTLVYGLVPPARSRLNALLFTGMFIGMAAGGALGSLALAQWGWHGVAWLAVVCAGGSLLLRLK